MWILNLIEFWKFFKISPYSADAPAKVFTTINDLRYAKQKLISAQLNTYQVDIRLTSAIELAKAFGHHSPERFIPLESLGKSKIHTS